MKSLYPRFNVVQFPQRLRPQHDDRAWDKLTTELLKERCRRGKLDTAILEALLSAVELEP